MFINRISLILVTVKVLFIIIICFEQLLICSSTSSSALSSLPFKVINNTVRIINNNKNNGLAASLIPAVLNKDHICTREENYTEIVQIPTQRTVRVRTSNWCLEIPPRCSNYRTEIREIIKIENVTKTRTIRFCCEGYAGIISGNETICRPICRGGCGRGYCLAPDECKCENGYIGHHCTQRCPNDHWGDGCFMKCQCRNHAICDHKTGACRCQSGWIGDKCHIPCQSGFYGSMCKTLCQCEPQECNPQTGQCIFEKTTTKLTIKKELIPFEKISANEMLGSLNSTISNLTDNLDKLAKNLITTDPITFIIPPVDLTTIQPITETILLIKPENSTILLHDTTLLETNDKTIDLIKSPEVIHIIDWNQQQLTAAISENTTNKLNNDNQTRDLSALIMSMIIFSLVFAIILIGFLIFYRQYFKKDHNIELPTNMNVNDGDSLGLQKQLGSKIFVKPLPDLPAFTQNLKKTDNIPEFYDCPSNNSAVGGRNLYSYVTGPIYTQVPKQYNRKESLESHLYDEIRYPPKAKSCRV